MIIGIYNRHKELWKLHRNTMLLISLLTALIVGLVGSIPVIGTLSAGLVIAPVIMAATYKAIQSEAPFSISLVIEKIKDSFTVDVVSMQWSIAWRLALWGLIPVYGLVKYYQYMRAFYIKLDNPEMSNIDCIRTSQEDMYGHKWDYFIKRILVALPMYLVILIWVALLVPVFIATLTGSGDVGTIASLVGVFVLPVVSTVVSFYYGAKLNHFGLVTNDIMEKNRRGNFER